MDKKAVVALHNGTLCGCKKERTLTLCDSIEDSEVAMLSEISQSEKDIQYDLTFMWNLMNKN